MIAEIAELEAARRLLGKEIARARAEGVEEPRSIKLGVMLEVPSLLWQLPALLQRIDFLSIGTNDLAQFLFACDRGNPRLAERYDLLSAPMISLFRAVVAECNVAQKSLSMCGEIDRLDAQRLADRVEVEAKLFTALAQQHADRGHPVGGLSQDVLRLVVERSFDPLKQAHGTISTMRSS
jgi:phosphoenolpyruvate-protein kinase (PTS system EI component)